MNILDGLNESQKEAASHIDGAMLILAGAGSGKTKTITTRLAYLIEEVGIPPDQTLTLTFTNKAAKEMRDRAFALLSKSPTQSPLLCTFHKFGLLFLRLHIDRLGRKNDFVIIDTDDQKKILKDLLGDDEKGHISSFLGAISHFKNHFKSVEDVFEDLKNSGYHGAKDRFEKLALVYKSYQELLFKNNFVDFDDLLFLTLQILQADEEFAKEQSRTYRYITIDEYQDTNALQYEILKQLCLTHQNIVVVGDDDQSIYSWRGAKIDNILNFQKQFDNVKLVKLEQNYRSTSAILNAANALIDRNKKRLGKTLVSTKESGEELVFLQSYDEKEEAFKITSLIKEYLAKGVRAGEIAILYRVNSLSRALEEALMKAKIPFKILSGMRFYERAEIKDIISYLRLLVNFNDDYSFKRIINRPKRGFGDTSLKKLSEYASSHQISLYEALYELQGSGFFSAKLDKEIFKFINDIQELSHIEDLSLLMNEFEARLKIKEFYKDMADGEDRVRNIDDFYANFKERASAGDIESLNAALSEISLQSDQDEAFGECVYMMSVHASKGLEFEVVFIAGLEDGFFPIQNESSDEEEERRLAYVAITRAKKNLFLSCVKTRFFRGSRSILKPSAFLEELGQRVAKIEPIKDEAQAFSKGDLVKHKIFGIGRVVAVTKDGKEFKLGINFGGQERTILASFVERVSSF